MFNSLRGITQGLPVPEAVQQAEEVVQQQQEGSGASLEVNLTGVGAPGIETIQTLLNWLARYSLWACLAALLAGGGMFAWSRRSGAHGMAMTGTALAGGGAVGVLIIGLAPQIVEALYQQT